MSGKLSEAQREVLTTLRDKGPQSADQMGAYLRTMLALSRRRWIQVDTTFDSIVFPRRAPATLTNSGRAALQAEAEAKEAQG